ncbi:nuclear transport factor 2 family protein [Haloplanus sp. GCM10025708]|uniref:nuclear transport factor 2 family protein n=1 Tax=Haloferacaceae TaxID=1644056 RepID=UPI00362266EE
MDRRDAVATYYEALDSGAYDRLADLLAPDFVQHRPDRTLDGRERFVAFMRDDRPVTDTTHAVDAVYEGNTEVAVRGRLRDADGETLVSFVDVFGFEGGRVATLWTYTR